MPCARHSIAGWQRILTALVLTALLAGCQPGLTRVTLPTPRALIVQVTPALTILDDEFQRCAAGLDNTGLVLLERPTAALDLAQSAITLRWGDQGGWNPGQPSYAAVIGREELVVVTHPTNPLESISLANLRDIYTGVGEETEIQAWGYVSGEDVQTVFQAALGVEPSARVMHLAPDPAAMRDAISITPGALGFLPRRWVNDSVKPLAVEGLDAALLNQPVLAWSKLEPSGQEKAWLICLQGEASE